MTSRPPYRRPLGLEHLINRVMGMLLRRGIGPAHMRVLEVRGRKTGRLYAMPVDVLAEGGRLYLVAPRGSTQWSRNAEASGAVTLRRGSRVEVYRVRVLTDTEKPAILKAYLDRFRREVQRFFPVAAGSPPERFAPLAASYPAYELLSDPGTRGESPGPPSY